LDKRKASTRNDEAKGLGQHPLDKSGTAQNRHMCISRSMTSEQRTPCHEERERSQMSAPRKWITMIGSPKPNTQGKSVNVDKIGLFRAQQGINVGKGGGHGAKRKKGCFPATLGQLEEAPTDSERMS
jgi:hypothetical protein